MTSPALANADFSAQRRNMVESQLRPNKVTDERILTAMETLPRELFVPAEASAISYMDEDIAIAPGRYLLEPMLLARLAQTAQIQPADRVLEIGCGTGYGTALLMQLSGNVTAIDSDSGLLANAAANLRHLGLAPRLMAAPLERGLPEHAPFDVIIVAGAVTDLSASWGQQLAENGRLLVIQRQDNGVAQNGTAQLYRKIQGQLVCQPLFDAQTPYLPGFAPKARFVF